jgi:hypothetical protein
MGPPWDWRAILVRNAEPGDVVLKSPNAHHLFSYMGDQCPPRYPIRRGTCMDKLGERLREERQRLRYTQAAFAAVGVSWQIRSINMRRVYEARAR